MLRGLYSAAGALEAATRNQEIVAENLSHAATPGYRRQGAVFEVPSFSSPNAPAGVGAGNSSPAANISAFTHQNPGPLQQTHNPLDVALVGNGFLIVDGPNGPLYTRNGGLELNAQGQLQTRGGGYRVRGQGGPITVPPNASEITVASDGTIFADGGDIGRLQFATFARPNELRRVGDTFFAGETPQTPPADAIRVQQGFREGSNVQAVQEMVSMMLGIRFYEAAEKSMRMLSDSVAQNTRPQS